MKKRQKRKVEKKNKKQKNEKKKKNPEKKRIKVPGSNRACTVSVCL